MSSRSRFHRTVIGPLAVGTAMIGAAALTAAPAHAAPVDVKLTGSLLTITGDSTANSLTVGTTTAGVITLNGTAVLGGTVTTAAVLDIVMRGADGGDTLRLDETNGAMPRIEFHGGEGNDQLVGGSKADRLLGGPGADKILGNAGDDTVVADAGNDKVIGGSGSDTVSLGADGDEFTWSPGDGDDRVDGDTEKDTLIFNGSDRAPADGADFETESLQFAGDGPRTTVTRFLTRQSPRPSEVNTLNFSGFELVKSALAGGPNSVFFGQSFSGSDTVVVRVDLGPPGQAPRFPEQGVDTRSRAGFIGTEGADRIRIGGSPTTGATVTGLGPAVVLTGAQILSVSGQAGDDVLDAGLLAAGTVESLQTSNSELADDGNDTLVGHPGNDQLFGGAGDDRIEGRGGNDILDGGTGNDVIIP